MIWILFFYSLILQINKTKLKRMKVDVSNRFIIKMIWWNIENTNRCDIYTIQIKKGTNSYVVFYNPFSSKYLSALIAPSCHLHGIIIVLYSNRYWTCTCLWIDSVEWCVWFTAFQCWGTGSTLPLWYKRDGIYRTHRYDPCRFNDFKFIVCCSKNKFFCWAFCRVIN